jgi:hypothetical protein
MNSRSIFWPLSIATAIVVALFFLVVPVVALAASQTFNATGADQTFIVPAGVTSINVQLFGAGGGVFNNYLNYGAGLGGYGGSTEGTLAVTPGEQLTIIVGKTGNPSNVGATTYGGGGAGGYCPPPSSCSAKGGAGGGRSAVRNSAGVELMTAGGGGGNASQTTAPGGAGGGLTGGNGSGLLGAWSLGTGGTQTQGGTTAMGGATSGSQFRGGSGGTADGGAGGGGWYGGGVGFIGTGGGGSGHCDASLTNCTTTQGGGSPADTSGQVIISWIASCPANSTGTFPNCVCDKGYTGNGQTGSDLVCTPIQGVTCSVTFDQNTINQGALRGF